jgi:hypothetical protein
MRAAGAVSGVRGLVAFVPMRDALRKLQKSA